MATKNVPPVHTAYEITNNTQHAQHNRAAKQRDDLSYCPGAMDVNREPQSTNKTKTPNTVPPAQKGVSK